ncbi:1-phosphatidylinositol-4,5-bisphosphate phosphodiesterase 1 [Trametes versicolor FP-101664 SS1]|uniref:Phosphoinositide phospholipase C n=1 Tax=Trametes versicolor (strain FP-101664) TaxID=717944 RepID=R7S8L9_TRAVS|nr:1-phosphatidylinositol-4,5-bisphosphate phosphodiesterase 1 [Trametes versicolor FP-101664 SS1]EIW52002.1 1-phosphatidylinositol-4,5-bisphosphate phosphodiesterase 1 [Trametes versicolor FP-101664 SS1]
MTSLPESSIVEQLPPSSVSVAPVAQSSSTTDATVPPLLQVGVPMIKVSAKKQKRYLFRLDADQGQIIWQSKKLRFIPIENIKELREGADARYYREQFQLAQEYEDRWLTIVYVLDGGYKTLHLISATRDIFQLWDVTLRRLYSIRQQLMSGLVSADMRQAVWEKQFWKGADDEQDQRLDFDDVERLCRRLNINPSREDLQRRFKQADSQNRGYLDFGDFKRFVKHLKARPEIDRLYKKHVNGAEGMTFAAFEQFMQTSQKSSLSRVELEHIFLRYAFCPNGKAPGSPPQTSLDLAMQSISIAKEAGPQSSLPSAESPPGTATTASSTSVPSVDDALMKLSGFTAFLLSADNSVFADQHGRTYHDMSRPLPEYFISSSHNTYLVGHQLVGESTIEGYIRALLHSCRSVELDIYDGDTEPTVYHGRTLTSKVSVRDACAAIAKYAFVASPYPIVISAEIHCSVPQQEQLVEIMKEVFGDALVWAPVDGRPKIDALPSPEDLKGRVLLKAKNLYVVEGQAVSEKEVGVETESSTSTDTSASDSDVAAELKQEWRKARQNEAELIRDLKSEFKKARGALNRVRSPGAQKVASQSVPQSPPPSGQPAKPKVKMSMELVSLLVYTVGVKCRGINKKEEYAPEHIFSLSENTANKLLKQGMMDLIKHNRTHLVRTYPKGTRIGSTNYEPHRYWSAGCQLVAINWQTFDLGYMINHAMFQRNGRAGYVLKPLALRSSDKQLLARRTKHLLNITIISAQQLPRPKDSQGREIIDKSIVDPFVEVSIHIPDWTHSPFLPEKTADAYSPPTAGNIVEATSARTVTCRTGVVKNNGFNPVWEQQICLPFDLVGDMKDLVFVRFSVKQENKEDDEPLAVYCASLGSLNLGYRHLPLHDGQLSQYLFSTLFVRIDIQDA